MMKRTTFIFILSFSFLLVCSCSTPIEKYQAKNDDEKKIIDLLIRYTEAVNKGDSEKIIPLFHENGVYVASAGSIILSREKMSKWKPEDWQALGIRKLYDPEITINGNEAKVMSKVKYGNTSYSQIFTLVKENDEWLIMRRE
jgi:DNA-binding transcriptional LysR family regulator